MAQKKKRLTIAELRTFKGYENTTQEEAENVIDSLEKFSLLVISLYQKKKEEVEKQQAKYKSVSEALDSEICTAENAADLAHDVNFYSVNVNKFLSWLFNKIIKNAKSGKYSYEVFHAYTSEYNRLQYHERVFVIELLEQLGFNVEEDVKRYSWQIDWHHAAQIMSM